MAKNIYVLTHLVYDDPFNVESEEVKGEVKVDSILMEWMGLKDYDDDTIENLLALEDEAMVTMMRTMWNEYQDYSDYFIGRILPLSTNKKENEDSMEKRAANIRKYLAE